MNHTPEVIGRPHPTCQSLISPSYEGSRSTDPLDIYHALIPLFEDVFPVAAGCYSVECANSENHPLEVTHGDTLRALFRLQSARTIGDFVRSLATTSRLNVPSLLDYDG